MALMSNGKECVICAATGSVVFKDQAVKVGEKFYRPGAQPGGAKGESTTPPKKWPAKKKDEPKAEKPAE